VNGTISGRESGATTFGLWTDTGSTAGLHKAHIWNPTKKAKV